jgi:hypothetical protein
MPKRTISEWHCDRCGNEQAIESAAQHYWRNLALSNYQGNPSIKVEPRVGGDLCPDCVGALIEWWRAGSPRRPAKAVA